MTDPSESNGERNAPLETLTADSRVEGWIRTLLSDSMLRPLYAVLLGHGVAFFSPILLFAFPGSTLSCGPCTYVQNLASVFILPVGDTSSYTWSMPCSVAPYVGVSFVVQWATLNSGTTPCAALPSIAFSERMNLTLDF